jgi:four helix bundle protein
MSNIEELDLYKRCLNFSNEVWNICVRWDFCARKTVGDQLVRAADSISANVAEGHGRYSIKENIHFCYYSRGSVEEDKYYIRKSQARKLMSESEIVLLNKEIMIIAQQLNSYSNSLKRRT